MKKFFNLFLTVFIIVFLNSCAFLSGSIGDVWVMESEHGKLNVSVTYENTTASYTIVAVPEAGYELLEDNVLVYKHDDTSFEYSIGIKTRDANEFYFSCDKKYDLVVNAYFTKVESKK